MATTKRTVAVGVFHDQRSAQQAVNELRRLGFTENQIGVVGPNAETMSGATAVKEGDTKAAEGAAVGVAAGAGLGALWGLGILAGVMPILGPAIAGGTLATILTSAAAGAAAAGIAGALIGLGIPEDEAEFYEGEFKSGRTIVTVRADGRYDEALATLRRYGAYDKATAGTATHTATAGTHTHAATSTTGAACATGATVGAGKTVQLREEELHARKQPVETGEVRVRKEVVTEHKTMDVPVKKEEVVIERHPVSGKTVSSSEIRPGEEIRIPVTEEQVRLEKQAVVKEEVHVGKRQVQGTEHVAGTVRKEELRVEQKGDVDVCDPTTGKSAQDRQGKRK